MVVFDRVTCPWFHTLDTTSISDIRAVKIAIYGLNLVSPIQYLYLNFILILYQSLFVAFLVALVIRKMKMCHI